MSAPRTGALARPTWSRWIDRTSIALAVPAAAAAAVLMLHVIVDVVSRTFFDSPLPSTLEIVQYWWMVLLVFPAWGFAQYRGEQIRATMLTSHLPARMKKGADIAALLLLASLGILITYYGWLDAWAAMKLREAVVAAWPVPIWPAKFLIPLGTLILTLQSIATIPTVLQGGATEQTHQEI